MKYCLAGFFFFFGLFETHAQDTVLVLPESTVTPLIKDPAREQQAIHTVSLRSGNLSDLLFSEVGINIRSYSAQGLSTLNYNGFGPEQTRISWNGMSLNNPMNGQLDLSLVPVFFLDNAAIREEGSSSGFNNPVGGELDISSGTIRRNDSAAYVIVPYVGTGSFGKRTGGLDLSLYGKKRASRTRGYYNAAENNYPYHPFGDHSKGIERLSHAGVEAAGLLQDLSFGKNTLSIWAQDVQRDLPSIVIGSVSEKHQSDRHLRMVFNRSDSNSIGARSFFAGFSTEELIYTDKVASVHSENRSLEGFTSFQQEKMGKRNTVWISGVDGQFSSARTSGYGTVDPIYTMTIRQHMKWNYRRWRINSGIKVSSRKIDRAYILPSAQVKYQWSSSVLSVVGYQRGLRFPTTNHLYWQPGGNPDVIAEKSDNVNLRTELFKRNFRIGLTLFGAQVYDRIQWLPNESGLFVVSQEEGLISPNYGLTLHGKGHRVVSKSRAMHLIWSANYHYTRSARDRNELALQNIFVPIHQFGGRLGIKARDCYFGWNQSYVSERYTTSTNDDWMKAYVLSDLVLSFIRDNWTTSLRVFNVFNQYYEMLPLRPMPMRSVQMNIQFLILNHNKLKK